MHVLHFYLSSKQHILSLMHVFSILDSAHLCFHVLFIIFLIEDLRGGRGETEGGTNLGCPCFNPSSKVQKRNRMQNQTESLYPLSICRLNKRQRNKALDFTLPFKNALFRRDGQIKAK